MAQQYWWKPGVVGMPSMSLGSGVKGGFVKVQWGEIAFAPDSFPSEPPAKSSISLDWGLSASDTLHIFDGEIYRRSYTNKAITYDIFEPEYDTKVLTEGIDVKEDSGDDDIPAYAPLVVGTVTYMTPQRTGTTVEEKYYMPDFATYDFYEDGVLINDHWTIGATYAERSLAIPSSLTMSGTGNMTTLADVFSWAAGEMGLTFMNVHSADVAINCVVSSQGLMIDFLNAIAYYCCYQFYIKDDILYLVDMDQDNGEQEIEEYDFVEIKYSWPMPIKSYTAEWSQLKFDPATVTLVDDARSVEHFTDSAIGDEVTITPYDEIVSDVTTKIEAIAAQDVKVVIALSLPLDRLPAIGERITFVDRKQSHNISGSLRVRAYSLNYSSKTLDIQGSGEITFA